MSGAYVHRPLGPSGAPAGTSNGKLNDLLDFVRQEAEVLTSEASNIKLQNLEYENHAHSQLKEMSALRHSFFEMQHEVEASKEHYEGEIQRLRRELELHRSGANTLNTLPPQPPSAGPHSDPREARNHQQLQPLYSLLPPANHSASQTSHSLPPASAAGSHTVRPTSDSGQPSTASHSVGHSQLSKSGREGAAKHSSGSAAESANGSNSEQPQAIGPTSASASLPPAPYRRDEPEAMKLDHPPKRLKMEDAQRPASQPHASYDMQHPGGPLNGSAGASMPMPATAPLRRPSPHPLDREPPASATKVGEMGQSQLSQSHNSLTPLAQLRLPQQQPPDSPGPLQQQQVAQPSQAASSDWTILENPKVQHTLDIELWHTLVHDSVVCCVKFSPDSRLLAAGCNRNTFLYNTQTGQRECTLVDPSAGRDDNYIRSACFTPDGTRVATGSEDRKIRIWDVASRTIQKVFEGHKNEIYSLVFSPDGHQLYSGSGDSSVKVWDMETGECKLSLNIEDQTIGENGHPADAGVTSVALSPDGRILAAGSLDTCVRIWDAQKGVRLDTLRGHRDSVYSVVFAPDASWLVSGSLDKTLKVWDLKTVYAALNKPAPSDGPSDTAVKDETASQISTPTETKTTCLSTLCGHKDYVLSVAVPPSGQWIVSGSKDRGVSFWDPKATLANVVLQGHKNSVISIATSDVNDLLATGSGDWSCRIWRYKPASGNPQQSDRK